MKFPQIKKEININLLELIIQAMVICIAIYSVGVSSRWWWAQQQRPFDFTVYYYAGYGVVTEGWVYLNIFMPLFSVLHMWDLSTSYLYLSGLSTLCFMFVAHKILELRFGWFFILINLYNFSAIIIHGNIHCLLLLLSLYPLGSLFSMTIKPFTFIIPVLFCLTKDKLVSKIKPLWIMIIAFLFIVTYPSKEVIAYVLKHNDLLNRLVLLSISIYYVADRIKIKDIKAMLKIKRSNNVILHAARY
jgi:hypothetical protein